MLDIFTDILHCFAKLASPRLGVGVGSGVLLLLASCSQSDDTYDPYTNWQARNEAWYQQIVDSARSAINNADSIAKYGEKSWKEDFCAWRMFKSLQKNPAYDTKSVTDSICVHIVKKGDNAGIVDEMPYFNDTVRISFRGYLMNATYQNDDGTQYDKMQVFSQTYYGNWNEETARPSIMAVSALVEGLSTAVQYMTPGDDWNVYIPQNMGYGATASSAIPAYSTLLFRINLAAVYRAGSGVPGWK